MKKDKITKNFGMNISLEYLDSATNHDNSTTWPYSSIGDDSYFLLQMIISSLVTLSICWMGLLGNGTVIWLLGFQIKRNPFTTFILNLAFADFGFLISMTLFCINDLDLIDLLESMISNLLTISFTYTMYLSGQFLLTAISVDRCVCVLFPIWHRLSRPNHLSTIVCALIWIVSFLLGGVPNTIEVAIDNGQDDFYNYQFFVSAIVCFPVITVSVAVLFIKLYLKSKQQKRGRLLLMIFVTLLCFLILAFPLNVYALIVSFVNPTDAFAWDYWRKYLVLCACLNSSVNPVIYFLIGRKKQGQSRKNLKVILQKAFKEDECDCEG